MNLFNPGGNKKRVLGLAKSGKVTFAHKGTIYEIVPYEDIGERLDSIMADLALAVCG